MTGESDRPVRRRRGCGRRILIWLLVPLLAAVLLVWYQRDLPRRTVQRELAARLGAEVHVGSLRVRGSRSFALDDLVIREVAALPWLASLRVRRVDVEGGLGEILEGRITLLRLAGVEARLAPPTREPAAAELASDVRVERLLLEDGRLLVEAGEAVEFALEADLRDVGSGTEGALRVVSAGFPIAPLLALRGLSAPDRPVRLSGFEAEATLAAAGRELSLQANSASTRIGGAGAEIDLPGAGLRATAVRDETAGVVRIDARPALPAVAASSLWVEIDAEDGTLLRGEATASGIALAELLLLLPSSFPAQGSHVEGSAELSVHVPEPGLIVYDVDAGIDSAETGRGDLRVSVRRAELRLEGSVLPGEGYRGEAALSVSAGRARVSAAGIDLEAAGLAGSGAGSTTGGTAPVEVEAELQLDSLAGALGGRELPRGATPLQLTVRGRLPDARSTRFEGELGLRGPVLGELRASGSITGDDPAARAALSWDWSGARAEELSAWLGDLDRTLSVKGRLAGRGRLEGEFAGPRVEGTIRVEELSAELAARPGVGLREGQAAAGFLWGGDEPELLLRSLELDGLFHADPLEPFRVRLAGNGRVAPPRGTARLNEAVLELDGLGRVLLDATWEAGSDPPLQARVGLEETGLSALRSRLIPLTGDPLPGYSLAGTLRSDLRLGWRPGGTWSCTGELRVGGPGVSSEDGSRVLQGGDVTLSVTAGPAAADGGASLDLTAPLEGPLLLWGTVFGDWSDRTARIDLHAEQPAEPGPNGGSPEWTARALLDLDDGPRLRAGLVSSEDGAIDYEVRAEIGDLAPVFERWVRAPLQDSLATLQGMEAGGAAAVELRGRLSAASRTLQGRLDLRNASMQTGGGGVSVRRLFVDLPWSLRWEPDRSGELRPVRTEPLEGSLAFGRLTFGDVRFDETSSGLVVEGDSVALQQELSMPFLDGMLDLERPTLVDALRPGRLVESGVRVSGVSLGSLTRALDIVPLEGTVDGRFPRVRLSSTALRVEGDGEFSLLGGRVVVREISGEEVLSRFPKVRFSAEFSDIDLEQLTHTFDFGEMRGTLQGWVRNCELFRWVPVRFQARLETVERKGVPQTLNVKAINNIAILGTGGRVSVFDRGIHKFLDRYNYSRLGVEMALAQDSFLLRGLERRGERELFLKGRLPFRIDVVNAQPGKAVSFRTMLDRLSTLDFNASTSAPPAEGLH